MRTNHEAAQPVTKTSLKNCKEQRSTETMLCASFQEPFSLVTRLRKILDASRWRSVYTLSEMLERKTKGTLIVRQTIKAMLTARKSMPAFAATKRNRS